MRKILATIIFLIGLAMLAPNTVLGVAYNDVSFTADTNLSVGGYTLVVSSGSGVAGIDVGTSSIDIDLMSGSWIKITSADKVDFQNSLSNTVCLTSSSYVELTSGSTQTVTVTPTGTCTEATTGGGGGGTTITTPAVEAEAEAEAETAVGEETVTATGGGTVSATTDEGGEATIEVPANAVSADTVITITPLGTADAVSGDVPAGSFMVGGYVYQFSATADGEAVTSFDQELTLTFTYTDSQIEGLDESSLIIYRWDTDASEWVALTSTVDADNNTVTATTTEFSEFALLGEESEEEEEEEEVPAEEMTIEELKAKILELQALIAEATAKLAALLGYAPITGVPADFSFETTLQLGSTGNDVKYLQIVLNSNADTKLADSGVGSPGNETTYFGPLTKAGVIKFQNKYSSDVLAPWGLTSGTGLVGSTTREKLNSLLGQ